jgi:site-specific recombinase XerD
MTETLGRRKPLSPMTAKLYYWMIGAFLRTKPDLTSVESYNTFVVNHAYKKRSSWAYSCLIRYIKWKIDEEKVQKHLIDNIIRPEQRHDYVRKRTVLDPDMLVKVYHSFPPTRWQKKHKVMCLFQTQSGVRAGDLLSVTPKDIKSEIYKGEQVVRVSLVGKRGKLNTFYIFETYLQDMVLEYIKDKDVDKPIFIDEAVAITASSNESDTNIYNIKRRTYKYYWRDLKVALKEAGVSPDEFATHDFRRSFARRFWEKYGDIQALQKVLHHTHIKDTVRYLSQSGMDVIAYHKEMQKDFVED